MTSCTSGVSLGSVTWPSLAQALLKLQSRSLVETTENLQPGDEGRKRVSGNLCEHLVWFWQDLTL